MRNLLALLLPFFLYSCSESAGSKSEAPKDSSNPVVVKDSSHTPTPTGPAASAAAIMARKQVPILCYHHIKNIDVLPKNSAGYTVTVNQFKAQMKTLADSGYHTITPDQLYNYLVFGSDLPSKPVMLTYDDTDEEQFSIAKPEMDKYGFKGVYFVMTVSIGRPNYMTREQIKQLADEGHVIACHTWDHHRTDKYISGDRMVMENNKMKKVNDWDMQVTKPKQKLEEITGKKVDYFAYPFGVWAPSGIPELRSRNFKLAFQLATKRDSLEPLFTVRRVLAGPSWTEGKLTGVLKQAFQ